jgi:hypothetical protein
VLIRVWRSVRIDVVGDLLCFRVNCVSVSCGWVRGFFVRFVAGRGDVLLLLFFSFCM